MLKKRIGQTNITSNGEIMTIVAYRNNQDIDVQFEDGVIMSHIRYDMFRAGKVSKYSKTTNRRIQK